MTVAMSLACGAGAAGSTEGEVGDWTGDWASEKNPPAAKIPTATQRRMASCRIYAPWHFALVLSQTAQTPRRFTAAESREPVVDWGMAAKATWQWCFRPAPMPKMLEFALKLPGIEVSP